MSLRDSLRVKAFSVVQKLPGKAGELALKANEMLGRPLADADELAERRAFGSTKRGAVTVTAQPKPTSAKAQAPVLVYFMDKQKRDVSKLTDILDANGVSYTVTNIQEDPAAQFAIRRDSKGVRLPVVFVAGECLGGREQLVNAAASGDLKKKVFG
jgi:glutaredoxin-related protein